MTVREVTYPMGHIVSRHVQYFFFTLFLLNAKSLSQSLFSMIFTKKKMSIIKHNK